MKKYCTLKNGLTIRENIFSDLKKLVLGQPDQPQWKLESQRNDLTTYTAHSGPSMASTKAELLLDALPEEVYNVLKNFDKVQDWDIYLKEIRIIESYDVEKDNTLQYLGYHSALPNHKVRYFLIFRCCGKDDASNSYIIGCKSVAHDVDSLPIDAEFKERMKEGICCDCFINGWILTPFFNQQENRIFTKCIYIHQIDFKINPQVESEKPLKETGGMYGALLVGVKNYVLLNKQNESKKRHTKLAMKTQKEAVTTLTSMSLKNGWFSHFKSTNSSFELLSKIIRIPDSSSSSSNVSSKSSSFSISSNSHPPPLSSSSPIQESNSNLSKKTMKILDILNNNPQNEKENILHSYQSISLLDCETKGKYVIASRGFFVCETSASLVFKYLTGDFKSTSSSSENTKTTGKVMDDIHFRGAREIEKIDEDISIVYCNNLPWSVPISPSEDIENKPNKHQRASHHSNSTIPVEKEEEEEEKEDKLEKEEEMEEEKKGMDCSLIQSKTSLPDGTYWIVYRSIHHSSLPKNNNYKRIQVLPSIYIIHPITQNSCLVSFCVQVLNPFSISPNYAEDFRVQLYNYIDEIAPIIGARIVSSVNTLRDALSFNEENEYNSGNFNDSVLEQLVASTEIDSEEGWMRIVCKIATAIRREQEEVERLDCQLSKILNPIRVSEVPYVHSISSSIPSNSSNSTITTTSSSSNLVSEMNLDSSSSAFNHFKSKDSTFTIPSISIPQITSSFTSSFTSSTLSYVSPRSLISPRSSISPRSNSSSSSSISNASYPETTSSTVRKIPTKSIFSRSLPELRDKQYDDSKLNVGLKRKRNSDTLSALSTSTPVSSASRDRPLPIPITTREFVFITEIEEYEGVCRSWNLIYPVNTISIETLPNQLIMYILSFLDAKSLCRSAASCKKLEEISKSQVLWKKLYFNVWKNYNSKKKINERESIAMEIDSPKVPEKLTNSEDWNHKYKLMEILNRNWNTGKITRAMNVITHSSSLKASIFLRFDSPKKHQYLLTGSSDKSVKLWKVGNSLLDCRDSIQPLLSIVGPNSGVISLHAITHSHPHWDDSFDTESVKIIIGYRNGAVNIFGIPLSTLINENANVNMNSNSNKSTSFSPIFSSQFLTLCDGYEYIFDKRGADPDLLIGWEDNVVTMWDVLSNEIIYTMTSHERRINTVAFSSGALLTGSQDKTVKLWDIYGTPNPLSSFQGHSGGISCIKFVNNNLFISGSNDKTLKLWDTRTPNSVRTYKGHVGPVKCLVMDDKTIDNIGYGSIRFASGGNDNSVKIWTLDRNYNSTTNTSVPLYTLEKHKGPVTSIDLWDNLLCSGSSDLSVNVYDFCQ